ncbi:unnamed protein product [Mytilus coruscus]|uniref:Tyr recombinase domain-containing protein n=1 Tax=Mytilus coruscus TaxID=42192 RepID=A0A6J8AY22_MYTCO|nr:unnamed protein product [Mytilus coruscus]
MKPPKRPRYVPKKVSQQPAGPAKKFRKGKVPSTRGELSESQNTTRTVQVSRTATGSNLSIASGPVINIVTDAHQDAPFVPFRIQGEMDRKSNEEKPGQTRGSFGYTHLYSLGNSPINVDEVRKALINYPHQEAARDLIQGLEAGFKLKYSGPRLPMDIDSKEMNGEKATIASLRSVCNSQYETILFSSAFSLAYFAMLRVSELAINSRTDESGHALKCEDITFDKSNSQTELHVKICSSKTDQKHTSITLIIQSHADSNICPITLLQSYLQVRFSGVNGSNELYTHFNGLALTKYQFCSLLQKCLGFCELPFHIRSHSFRIERATDMAKNGVKDDIIKQCGRWSSVAYLRYIRI